MALNSLDRSMMKSIDASDKKIRLVVMAQTEDGDMTAVPMDVESYVLLFNTGKREGVSMGGSNDGINALLNNAKSLLNRAVEDINEKQGCGKEACKNCGGKH